MCHQQDPGRSGRLHAVLLLALAPQPMLLASTMWPPAQSLAAVYTVVARPPSAIEGGAYWWRITISGGEIRDRGWLAWSNLLFFKAPCPLPNLGQMSSKELVFEKIHCCLYTLPGGKQKYFYLPPAGCPDSTTCQVLQIPPIEKHHYKHLCY